MTPTLRRPTKKTPGRPKARKPRTCHRCHKTLSTSTKLKNHLLRKTGKVYSIKRELDKAGWWGEIEGYEDEETKEGDGDETMGGGDTVKVWQTAPDNLRRAKGLARLDWTQVIQLR
ncbi:hypothetical protein PPTG_23348 [Phytophthora nicotianae INRA-310]|uniref:C2H2-type domain-containing protein n=1 Tax=Phytophthora nicotianae (strain INRA-310) TaxID=761204 RepID=W2Q0W2_PHYN3|nr:hypothetical protein PPTG_23348 [Phytophthora nicotianae INRA-310]ETN06752.1 hypothetical protein PPTG_23348 [Phytophthora nicotianae INRA-310]